MILLWTHGIFFRGYLRTRSKKTTMRLPLQTHPMSSIAGLRSALHRGAAEPLPAGAGARGPQVSIYQGAVLGTFFDPQPYIWG